MTAMPLYQYAQLFPSGSENAEVHNAPLLGAYTLGIEVTEENSQAVADRQHRSAT